MIIEKKCTINMMWLNHSQIISPHPWSVERFSSMKLVSGAKNVGGH